MVMVVVMMMMPPSVGTFMVQSVAAIPVVVLGIRTGPVLFAGLFRTQPRRRRSGGDRCRLGQGVQVVQVVEVVETGWWGQVVKVRIVLGGRGRREGVVVVGFGIFGTFLKIPILLLVRSRTVVVVIVEIIPVDVVQVVDTNVTDASPHNVIITVVTTPVMVVVTPTCSPSSPSSSPTPNIIRRRHNGVHSQTRALLFTASFSLLFSKLIIKSQQLLRKIGLLWQSSNSFQGIHPHERVVGAGLPRWRNQTMLAELVVPNGPYYWQASERTGHRGSGLRS